MFAAFRNIARLSTIIGTLRRHDALFPLELLASAPRLGWLARRLARERATRKQGGGRHGGGRRRGGRRRGERLADALQELGPTFIKLGQALSTRPDLLGADVAEDLSSLQDRLSQMGREHRRTPVHN